MNLAYKNIECWHSWLSHDVGAFISCCYHSYVSWVYTSCYYNKPESEQKLKHKCMYLLPTLSPRKCFIVAVGSSPVIRRQSASFFPSVWCLHHLQHSGLLVHNQAKNGNSMKNSFTSGYGRVLACITFIHIPLAKNHSYGMWMIYQ